MIWMNICHGRPGRWPIPLRQEKPMTLKALMAVAALSILALSGCASTGGTNTTYAQYQGYSPVPDFGASDPGGVRISY